MPYGKDGEDWKTSECYCVYKKNTALCNNNNSKFISWTRNEKKHMMLHGDGIETKT